MPPQMMTAEETQVREATRKILPMVDLESVKERQVMEMVEARLGILLAPKEEEGSLRGAVTDEIDRYLLGGAGAQPPKTAATGAGMTNAGVARKRRRPVSTKSFIADDDEDDDDDDDDFVDDDEEEEWDDDDDDSEDEDVAGTASAEGKPGRPRKAAKNVVGGSFVIPEKKNKTSGTATATATVAGRWNKDQWSAAREAWAKPAPPPSVVAATDQPGAASSGASGSSSQQPSLDDKLVLALTLKPAGSTAKELASFLSLSKSDVNKALYRLQAAGRTKQQQNTDGGTGGGAPKWIAAPGGGGGGGGGGEMMRTGYTTGKQSGGAAAAGAATGGGGGGGDADNDINQGKVEGQVCVLSRTRRCTVSDYRGKKYVGLREYYEKDGAWLPGKKGISLSREQWTTLRDKMGEINDKVTAAGAGAGAGAGGGDPEDAIVCQLAPMRRVTVGTFRGAVMVGIREFYEKDGKMLPGKKGISLGKEQWDAVCSHRDAIDAACDDM